jgi:N-(2-amino-2-carboxyethyl)-L-glutamate synthase
MLPNEMADGQWVGRPLASATLIVDDAFVCLPRAEERHPTVYWKLEGFNLGGSIKMKPALAMIESMSTAGLLPPAGRCSGIIESSSGNLGVALSIVCAQRGLPFICVTDINATKANLRLMRAYGATVVVIEKRDENGGFLKSRIDFINRRLEADPHLRWTNQYANAACKEAHKRWTSPVILRTFPRLDYLFVGAGTTGTLMGCCEYFREHSANTRVIGVDTIGSITFYGRSGPRHIPGLGASRRPELFDPALPHDLIEVHEEAAIRGCRYLRDRLGLLLGGSTGTVLSAIEAMHSRIEREATVVAIAPDFGERYLDSVYDDAWVADRFPHFFVRA